MKKLLVCLGLAGFLMLPAAAMADSIYGDCTYESGSKCGGSVYISTSWNSKRAYPASGRYTLDFGKKLGTRITVYCNGNTVGTVHVSGATRFDVVCR